MTDEPDDQLDPASPQDEARIRELLSDARATGPMPADVAARLDSALVDLAAERGLADPVPADNVIPITRTRRHRVVAVLGAAAAVAVFGLGLGAVLNSESGGDDDAGSAADSAVDRGGDDGAAREDAAADAPDDDEHNTSGEVAADPREESYDGDQAFAVRPRELSGDLARIQTVVLPEPGAADYDRGLVHAPKGFTCELTTSGRGILVGVRYDGSPAFVRFLEPIGDSQVVEVLQCGTGDILRSTTLPTQG
jgi:hypothetical protein